MSMTLDALIHDISGQLVNVEGLVYELQQALDTLSSDAAEAANLNGQWTKSLVSQLQKSLQLLSDPP